MNEPFAQMLAEGRPNSLGRVDEVISIVVKDHSKLDALYSCLFHENMWVRMRAADALEKICRDHQEWIEKYIDKFLDNLSDSTQPSIQWHLVQIYSQVKLSDTQLSRVISWLENILSSSEIDWIVSANAMSTLAQFTNDGSFSEIRLKSLLETQKSHKSEAVIRRADKILSSFHK